MITFKVISGIKECKALWEEFSPKRKLFDLWDFRYCFYDYKRYKPYFIVGYKNLKPIGVIPLWYDKTYNAYEFFGGGFPETNQLFLNDKKDTKEFLNKIPNGSQLFFIDKSETIDFDFAQQDMLYYIDFSNYNYNFESYIGSFNKKHRKNFRYDLRQLEKLEYEVKFGNSVDCAKIPIFNKKRFGSDSFFSDKCFSKGFKKLVKIAEKQNMLQVISIKINGSIQACEVAVIFNNTYYVLMGGSNIEYKNLGKLLITEHMKNALKKGVYTINFSSSDAGWKKLWNLSEEPVYEYIKWIED